MIVIKGIFGVTFRQIVGYAEGFDVIRLNEVGHSGVRDTFLTERKALILKAVSYI